MNTTSPNSFLLTHALYNDTMYDVYVVNGSIAQCQPTGTIDAPRDTQMIDAGQAMLMPSFIDAHVHLREPGFEYKEDIQSGLCAAAHGGFGTVFAMANTQPVNDTASTTRFMIERAKIHWPHGPHMYPIGALTIGLEGTELAPMGELAQAGCIAFSNDGKPVSNTEIFRRAVEYAAQWNRIVIDHCEDPYLAKGTHMNEGSVSGRIGVKGQPVVAESMQVARDILLSEYLDLPIHLAHVSCKQSVELIANAKARGIKITAETCPHYLLLDETELTTYNTNAKVCPPLRSAADVSALRQAVKDGVFDMFATDHAPHASHEKEQPFDQAPNGLIGLETAVPLTYTLVREGILTLQQFIAMWQNNPARIFGLPVNRLESGNAADFFLFTPDAEWEVSRETLHSKSINTPFLGKTMQGKVTAHWIGGYRIV